MGTFGLCLSQKHPGKSIVRVQFQSRSRDAKELAEHLLPVSIGLRQHVPLKRLGEDEVRAVGDDDTARLLHRDDEGLRLGHGELGVDLYGLRQVIVDLGVEYVDSIDDLA